MNTQLMFSSKSDEWSTPADFFAKLDSEFHFTLDACATAENHKCERYYTAQDDGLEKDWKGETVFCNPPYSRIAQWVKKAWKEGRKVQRLFCWCLPELTHGIFITTYTTSQKYGLSKAG